MALQPLLSLSVMFCYYKNTWGYNFFCAGLIDHVLVFCKMLFRSHLEGCGENALFII